MFTRAIVPFYNIHLTPTFKRRPQRARDPACDMEPVNGIPKPLRLAIDTDGPNAGHEAEPGITFDKKYRIFRLQCRSSTYAFRVDDDKNLEHLYWGPALPNSDSLLYLTKSAVAAPFDPVGTIPAESGSVAKLLGLDELSGADIPEKWKVYTRQKDAEEGNKRGRRLENASWRLWQMERNRGGDLNIDVSKNVLESSLRMDQAQAPDAPGPAPPTNGDAIPGVISGRGHATDSTAVDGASRRALGMLAVRSVGDFLHYERSHQRAQPPGSPRIPDFDPARQFTYPGTPNGSFGDMTATGEHTWQKLDTQLVGKNTKLLEWSDCGTGDYREPSFKVRFQDDGSSICPLEFKGYRITTRKLNMPDSPLPTVYTDTNQEATTLMVEMQDKISNVKVQLFYTVMHDYDVIIRRSVVINEGTGPVTLQHIASGTVDFDAEHQYYMTQLSGGWARERQVITRQLEDGVTVVKSVRGTSSHQVNPFVVITPDREPSEDTGECFGFCFVYSGNFAITAEVSEYRRLRVNVGINQEMFSWHLDPKDGKNTFFSPELIMTHSSTGLGGMSRGLHRLIRERLVPRQWRYKVPPVLLNTWEAVYFDFTHEIVVEIARCAAAAGVELLVLDDGWFGKRDNTRSGLGDWTPNREKLPFGLDGLARAINEFGLKFGIWIEPEMVSVDSDLFRKYPEWCLCVPSRRRTTGRNQLVLDFSRDEVTDHIYQQLHALLSSAHIEYVKWDMNRHLTEIFSETTLPERQGEVSHRFMLGVYKLFRRLTTAFPEVRFESCSGGGGRFDAGMLSFAPQIWASDNTDALSRMKIQFGTSLAYPMSTMGAHVSEVPNHQTGRSATMKTRSLLAMCGTFGYELDPRKWSVDDVEEIKGYIAMFKRVSPLIYEGDLYRLWDPFRCSSLAWMFVSRDKLRAIVFAFKVTREVGRLDPRLRLRGLLPDVVYCVEELCPGTVAFNPDNGAIMHDPRGIYQMGERIDVSGRTLMAAGVPAKFLFDGDSLCYELCAVDEEGKKLFDLGDEDHLVRQISNSNVNSLANSHY